MKIKKPFSTILFLLFLVWILAAPVTGQGTTPANTADTEHVSTKSRPKLLPVGEALVFSTVGTGIVIWLRRQRILR